MKYYLCRVKSVDGFDLQVMSFMQHRALRFHLVRLSGMLAEQVQCSMGCDCASNRLFPRGLLSTLMPLSTAGHPRSPEINIVMLPSALHYLCLKGFIGLRIRSVLGVGNAAGLFKRVV